MEIPDAPKRVLALAPSLTEMIYSIGAEAKMVGATRFSDYPPAAGDLPRVGSYIQLDLERIVALRPDLCFAIKDGNPKQTVDAIKALGIPVFAVDPHTINQIMDTLLVVGDLLNEKEQAQTLVSSLRQRVARVHQRVASSKARPGVFFQIADSPLISAGKGSFIDRLITLAGGTNLAGGAEGYPRYSWEDILVLQPEVVLISSMTGGENPQQLKEAWQRWPSIPAVRYNRLYVVKADLFNRPTARLIDGLETLADILHPNAAGGENGK
ncbi:MAG: cobalamin-binding protein [Deltaproteobacteria bacterium]